MGLSLDGFQFYSVTNKSINSKLLWACEAGSETLHTPLAQKIQSICQYILALQVFCHKWELLLTLTDKMRAVLQAVTFETLMSIPSVLYCCADHSKSIISVAVISPSQKEHKYIGARKATSGCPLRSQSALKLGP